MIKIPYVEFTFTFSRSSGAGGQNVNKLNTRASLTWDIKASTSCFNSIKERFYQKYKRFIFDDKVVIHSQRYRSQAQNIDDCIAKLHELLKDVQYAPKHRKSTKPTRSSIKKRLESKKKNSNKKRMRREKF